MIHWVKIFSINNGVIEGVFIPTYSNEHQITIYADSCAITMPWQNISRAVFMPEVDTEKTYSPYNYDGYVGERHKQLSLFPRSQ